MNLNDLIEETKKSLHPDEIDLEKSEQEEEGDDRISFSLEDSVDDDFKKGYVDVDPFFEEIASKVNLNNNRLSKAVEGLINLSIAQAEVVKGLESDVKTLSDMVKAFSEAPVARKAALTKGEAEAKVAIDRFEKGETEPELGLEEAKEPTAPTVAVWREKLSKTLRKGLESKELNDVYDIIRFQNAPVTTPVKNVINALSEGAQSYICKAHPELENL